MLVAVTCDRRPESPTRPGPRVRPPRPEVFVGENVVLRLRRGGAGVVLLPPGDPAAGLELLAHARGLVITGGAFDIHPRHYGQVVSARLDRVDEDRTTLELELARRAVALGIPVLGLCGGMQALAVALGGSLVQDIRERWPEALEHEQPTDPALRWHPLEHAHPLLPAAVNSTHHQAVDDPGPMRVVARAPDGVIEAVELPGHPFCIGVQWHPELLDDALFAALVEAGR